jgi:hypothetical protein
MELTTMVIGSFSEVTSLKLPFSSVNVEDAPPLTVMDTAGTFSPVLLFFIWPVIVTVFWAKANTQVTRANKTQDILFFIWQ